MEENLASAGVVAVVEEDSSGRAANHFSQLASKLSRIEQEACLRSCCSFGYIRAARTLVRMGVNVNAERENGVTALFLAVGTGGLHRLDTIRLLLASRANVNQTLVTSYRTPLHEVCAGGANDLDVVEVVQLLISHGALVDARTDDAVTPLMFSCHHGLVGVAAVLLRHGADVNAKQSGGRAPLMHVCSLGRVDMAKFLLENGADVNAEDDINATALMVASEVGPVEVIELLLERGAKVNGQTRDGMSPLMIAACHGQLESVKYLLDHGASLASRLVNGMTPLMCAIAGGDHLEVCKYLVAKGADLFAKDHQGRTASDWIIRLDRPQLESWLE